MCELEELEGSLLCKTQAVFTVYREAVCLQHIHRDVSFVQLVTRSMQ